VTPLGNAAALAAAIRAIQAPTGGQVLVGAAGPDAERAVLEAGPQLPEGTARVVRVGILGDTDAETIRALAEAGLTCGVRVAPATAPATGWDVRAVGACTPKAPDAALDAALAAPPVDRDTLEKQWREQALVRVNLGNASAVPWTLRDGKGRTLNALEVARTTGDLALQKRLLDESRHARFVAWGLTITSAALGVTAIGTLVSGVGAEPVWPDYEPSPLDYPNNEAFETATAEAQFNYDNALNTWKVRRADRAWAAGTFALGAVMAGASAPIASRASTGRQREIAWHWTVKDADTHLAAYNDSLRVKLGLPPIALPESEQKKAAPTPEPEEEEEDLGLPEDTPTGPSDPDDLGGLEDLDTPTAPAPAKEKAE
jgi:hypothetical protein